MLQVLNTVDAIFPRLYCWTYTAQDFLRSVNDIYFRFLFNVVILAAVFTKCNWKYRNVAVVLYNRKNQVVVNLPCLEGFAVQLKISRLHERKQAELKSIS